MTLTLATHDDARLDMLRALVADDPENELALFSLGQALFERRAFAEAEPLFARAARLQPDLMMAHLRQGECLLALGQPATARQPVETARQLAIAQNHVGPRGDAEDLLDEIADALD
ncbi:MAG: tetratricopeptide repeat protein [Deltaproteobacteria bacterium]|nr:tetratricopeptide repeat protein [Deltaproteobacteria bacterium]